MLISELVSANKKPLMLLAATLVFILSSTQTEASRNPGGDVSFLTNNVEYKSHSRHLLQTDTCVTMPATNLVGDVLTNGAANLQPSSGACCSSCWSQARQAAASGSGFCNTWVWCGVPGGCDNGYGTIYPYQQCTLKVQTSLQGAQPSVTTTKEYSTTFTSGWIPSYSSVVNQQPSVAGYSRYPGIDFQGFYDYQCPESINNVYTITYYCQVSGSLTSVAAACTADASCNGFVYVPSQSMAWLKGLTTLADFQNLYSATPNPNSVTYVKMSSS
ncbi:hypothetical protein WJX75_003695 [Coccomyxa subellipsoidea]|uniref:Apple domain-containing protein n=1 Tax=Coccomyxa subellipsoidea TaxID=248742 RepID=A0ABR2Z3A1_9CHLO